MSKKNKGGFLLFGCVVVMFLVGCGEDLKGRKAVSGKVTLSGAPLTQGEIRFEPAGTQKYKTQSGGKIVNGVYSIAANFGLVPGVYAVTITSMEEVPGSRVEGKDPMDLKVEYRDIVPPKFGSASEQKVTVTDTGKQTFDFVM